MEKMTDTEILKLLDELGCINRFGDSMLGYRISDVGCGCCSYEVIEGELAEYIYKRLDQL